MLKVKYLESGNNLKAGNTKRKRYFWLAIAFMVVLLLSISYSPVFAEETDDTGWVTENSNTYYTVNGKRVKGWRKIDKKYYYFDANYILQKNKIVGSKQKGYYYVDRSGVRVTAPEIRYAVSFVMKNSSPKDSRSKRLRDCFEALCKYQYYRGWLDNDISAASISSYAKYMFQNHRGNCYRYASSLAYIARVLGYDSRVVAGGVTAYAHNNLSPHGWCEVKTGNTWKMCDCSMQNAHRDRNLFLVTRKAYPFRLRCDKAFTMNIKGGKVTWK